MAYRECIRRSYFRGRVILPHLAFSSRPLLLIYFYFASLASLAVKLFCSFESFAVKLLFSFVSFETLAARLLTEGERRKGPNPGQAVTR